MTTKTLRLNDQRYGAPGRDGVRGVDRYALEHRDEALAHALAFGRGLDRSKGGRFVGMHVGEAALDYGGRGRRGTDLSYRRARQAGLIPRVAPPDLGRG